MATDAEGEPDASCRQKTAHVEHRFGSGRRTAADAETHLHDRRADYFAVADQVVHQQHVTCIKDLEFWLDASPADRGGHLPDMGHCVDEDKVAHIHAAEVEAAHFRP